MIRKIKRKNRVEGNVMELELLNSDDFIMDKHQYNVGYARGVRDVIEQILKIQDSDIDEKELHHMLNSRVIEMSNGQKNLATLLTECGFVKKTNKSITASDIALYPNAAHIIGEFINKNATKYYNEDENYLIFAGAFEHMVDIFSKEINDHIKGGGQKVGILIAITYITMKLMYKIGILRLSMTISASYRLFGKEAGAVKRILNRLRDNERIMNYIEGDGILPSNLGSAVKLLIGISEELSL